MTTHYSNTQSPTNDLPQYTGVRTQPAPSSPVRMRQPSFEVQQPFSAAIENGSDGPGRERSQISRKPVRIASASTEDGDDDRRRDGSQLSRKPRARGGRQSMGQRQTSVRTVDEEDPAAKQNWPLPASPVHESQNRTASPFKMVTTPPKVVAADYNGSAEEGSLGIDSAAIDGSGYEPEVEQLQYHHTFESRTKRKPIDGAAYPRIPSNGSDYHSRTGSSDGHATASPSSNLSPAALGSNLSRPLSAMTLGSELHGRGRSASPQYIRPNASLSPARHSRVVSNGHSPDSHNSTMDLLNIPYAQQMAHQSLALDHAQLRGSVGVNASLLDTRKTLEMYRGNVRKTNDPAIQYEFAVFMVSAAQEALLPAPPSSTQDPTDQSNERAQLLLEARQILQKLADRSYVYAQYYLADGYFSGLFNKGKPDMDHAFPLFQSAGKHGHAEAGYRTALCHEFGWGCRKDYAKAVQFYRQSASKNHPGAATRLGLACLQGDMGLAGKYREGVKWLKRATESADTQHNAAPYELGLLHTTGFGDDIFRDDGYAAQLFTKAAELGHAEAGLRMGEAYEHGLLTCPKDPALSIHFYTGAAQGGIPKAMMALCAWYMVGAEPVLDKDEAEAYEWAKRSAEAGYAKAAYAVGYFTEMGIGCRRDPLEANVWYVRAADSGEERARQRLAIIRAAETGDVAGGAAGGRGERGEKMKKKGMFW